MDTAEFDRFADEYDQVHEKNVAVTGEKPRFFHEYKIKVLGRMVRERGIQPESILDFGSGIGSSTPFFRRYFPSARLASADVSQRSLDVAASRYPDVATGLRLEGQRIPADIPQEKHTLWLRELRRVTRPGGMLAIFEQNPMNPLTVRAVNTCPFDENVHLIRVKELVACVRESGWQDPKVEYHLFFPHALSGLRRLEPYLSSVPFGGQYSVTAVNRG